MDECVFQNAAKIYEFLSSCLPIPTQSDFILVLGSHDLRVPDHAASLFLSGVAPLIICTGGYGKMTEGIFRQPEAVLFTERCIERGVPKDCILIEDRATNTGENFSLSRQLAGGRGFKDGIVVCKPYMAKRAWATGTKQWPEIQWGVSVPDIPFEKYTLSETTETTIESEIELMVGDLQRLKIYAEKGYQSPVSVPPDVWNAWQYLVDIGFDRYILS